MFTRFWLLSVLMCFPIVARCAVPQLPGIGAAMQAAMDAREIAGAVTVVVTKDKVLHLEANGTGRRRGGRSRCSPTRCSGSPR